ncbi:GH36-type glycosyl hydrolase domain-containing protein [Candidatus Binatus sp.]|uniref:GH36-type glycosyl hydrolase domain-containing protein n=1 Tax=Candidatus Binatus sp. TaxID=2811406 RepID=UPI00351D1E87
MKGPAASFARDAEEPIRAELFSIERLEEHGETLAVAQRVTDRPGAGRPMASRVRANARVLLEVYRGTAAAIREERAITPAAEWLVDNFHVVEQQIREIRDDLPRGFYRQLPKLADGPLEGYPRVFGIAWAFVAHTDSHFDPQTLSRFVQAYQRVQPLTIGELWAVAITLRIVLVENLRRLAARIAAERTARQQADALADRLLGDGGREPEPAATALRALARSPLSAAFAVQLVQRLRDQDPKVTPALRWLDQRLREQGTTADEIVRTVHHGQGATNVTVRNVITSMRLMSAVDWAEFFESVSVVDAVLRADSDFAAMDFPTRDRYRHAIEELARGSGHTEIEVAEHAIAAAKRAAPEGPNRDAATARREHDPGYYLISRGLHAVEKELGFRAPIRDWIERANAAAGIKGYLGTIAVVSALILATALFAIAEAHVPEWTLFILAIVGVIPAMDTAVTIVNRAVTICIGPASIPALELHDGVPSSLRTMVVMPTLLTTPAELEEQVERLEVHYLASPDGELRFALLSDWCDCATESAAGDDELLGAAAGGIARLNLRHGPAPDGERFILLHRRRVWDEAEGKWMGWERKRGKLHELNRLLRGATDTNFIGVDGRPPLVPAGVRYVITLDADTRLPRGAAKRLVGKMAHPLNAPRFDPQCGRVVEGYGVLQPRVTPSLPTGREGSVFQRVFSSASGIDPYAFAVSDVYQDLLGEGSYSGKGIYDVDVFEAALRGRVPDNTLLSHDLFEGTFARSGLASDVEVVEEFPSRYDVAAARQHRWARGDWQLLPWILGRGHAVGEDRRRMGGDGTSSAIPALGRWKMIDNLRRTLSAPTAFIALIVGWMLPFSAALIWTGFVIATIATAPMLPFITGIVPRRLGISKRSHVLAVGADLASGLAQIAMLLTLLAHQAWLMTDAIARTLNRLLVSHRRLLEWVTGAQAKLTTRLDLRGFYQRMAGGVALGAAAAIFVAFEHHRAGLLAVPFVLLWLLAPVIARWASLPPPIGGAKPVSIADARALRLTARRTWRFFEKFVTAEDNLLPPDNFQEVPIPVVAHRTSPTNLGLYLLSVIAAHDFGWAGTHETIERLDATLATMNRLELFRGHFYNWYGTSDLRPLEPRYVSSVDSGNLAGHLIALGNACREMITRPVLAPQRTAGIEDLVALTRESLGMLTADRRTHIVTPKQLEEALDSLCAALRSEPLTPVAAAAQMAELLSQADSVSDIARALTQDRADSESTELLAWAESLRGCIWSHQREIELLIPWATLVARDGDAAFRAKDSGPICADDGLGILFDSVPTLATLADRCDQATGILMHRKTELAATPGASGGSVVRIDAMLTALKSSAHAAISLERRLTEIGATAGRMFDAMKFDFLFDPARQLLSIGYRVTDGILDPNCYDLLASEARLASFVAIAKGDVPVRHWFRLGRGLTPVVRGSALISWSGSMFEYLMPSLVMRAPLGSLLEQTNRLVVRRQIKYGAELGMPWGVSESAFNARDLELTYQYSNFGVPGLGLKRGLSENAVIAPYATALAAMVDAEAAVLNFARLLLAGGLGRFGWYEALDYTPSRVPEGETVAIVRAYMAHHQGMTLVAIADALLDGAMRARFHSEPIIQATELLLQERTPRDVAVARPRAEEVKAEGNVREITVPTIRRFHSPHDLIPRTHLLSNGNYTVMITAAGSGFSRWREMAVTRWREDVTCDSWGSYIFLRDVGSGKVWSAGYQPSGVEADSYEVEFSEDRAEIVRRDGALTTTLEVAVSAEDDAEVRRVSISNLGNRVREIELTSYAEVVLAPDAADAAHPAFSKMFVQTEFDADIGALLATRRLRSPTDAPIWAAHLAVVEGESIGEVQFETDRARFLGRGRDAHMAISATDGRPLSDTVGTVLDPIFSLRRRVRIPAGATARVAFWTMVAPTRAEVLDQADKHHDSNAFERVLTLAWTQAQVQLHHLRVGADEAHLFQRLANRVLYSDPTLRPSPDVLKRGEGGPSKLWGSGISGDLPIVLVRIDEAEDLEIVRELVRAHEYWRMKRLAVDLVILNERPPSYDQDLQAALEALVRTNLARPKFDGEGTRGSVFVLRSELVSVEVRSLLQSVARAVLLSRRGTLSEQVKRLEMFEPAAAPPPRRAPMNGQIQSAPARREIEFFNGLGGFAKDGSEYVTTLGEGQWTPAPWINVIANSSFGFQVSVEGAGYTWSVNSRENQITQWSNDPVGDRPSEVIYVRDEDSDELWGPSALPIREDGAPYVVRHGQGYSVFEHSSHGVSLELQQYVPLDDSIKISRLKIRNLSTRVRHLSVTAYAEWVLGTARGASAPFVVTELDAETRAMFARNPFSNEYGSRVAFADLNGRQLSWTADRTEFLGRNGTLDNPAALADGRPLSNRVGAALDPCCAMQTPLHLRPNGEAEIVFFLGEAATRADAVSLIAKYRSIDLDAVLADVTRRWNDVLGAVQVKTPDRSMDIMLNRWLLYQTLACRVWARSAFYQASGAFGFRDQLQDVMALTVAQPALAREHLIRAAARQFADGDVQHWWLPPLGQGVRTRVSDDRIWLPFAAAHYVEVTGDLAILDETAAFLDGPALRDDQQESYFQPMVSEQRATLFEHCARALDLSLSVGAHGLPLMGSGDWNDGMNRVGEKGKGESVWLGWFLYTTLLTFAAFAERRGEEVRTAAWRNHAAELRDSLKRSGWDGNWYRRGYFDDGTPLGSAGSIECRIDSIAQSWGVISGGADPAHGAAAMAAVDEYLVRKEDGLVLLFTPPFDKTPLDPGYIKGYPPGIRENGGQYTHGAIWSVIAFAMLGDGDQAGELFSILNPINHANTRAGMQRYKVEPYVASADVYSMPPHVGRGGWTWYTGSAGWMYRAGLEWILGFRLRDKALVIEPCIPKAWKGFEMSFKYHSARYDIAVENPRGVSRGVTRAELDGELLTAGMARIDLCDDAVIHRVRIVLG